MPLRLGGISSGLDTQSLIQQLMQVEKQPLVLMQNKQQKVDLRKGLLEEINSSLNALKDKIASLAKKSTWTKVNSTISDEDVLTAKTGENSITGRYEFTNIVLATATKAVGNELVAGAATKASVTGGTVFPALNTQSTFDGLNPALNDGVISINDVTFNIDADVTKIDDFLNQVNSSTAGVRMWFDSSAQVFKIESKTAGADAVIKLTDTTGFLAEAGIATGTTRGTGTVNTTGRLTAADTGIAGLASDGGKFYFKINGYAFSFDESDSMNEVMERVNSSAAGVNMIYDSSLDKIIMTNKSTGASNILVEDIQGNFLTQTGLAGAAQVLGQGASFNLNGQAITKDSNEFTINGTTFTLKTAGSATVDIKQDNDAIMQSIKDFVNQYNSTVNLSNVRLSEETVKDATTEAGMRKGLLRGDSTVVGIRSSLRSIATSVVEGSSSVYNTLMKVGITTESTDFGKSGKLVIDETKLKNLLESNPGEVKKLFLEDTDDDGTIDTGEKGMLANLHNKIQTWVSTSTISINGHSYKAGLIPMRLDSMEKEIDRYDDQMADFQTRLDIKENRYWAQFTSLEKMLSQMQNQGNWLSGQLSSLQNV